MIDENLHELLLKSLDSPLSEAEKERLEQALNESEELSQLREIYLQQRALISNQKFRLKPFMATRVLAKLDKQSQESTQEWAPGLSLAFKRIALPVFGIVVITLVTTLISEQQLTLDAILGISELSIDDLVNDLIVSI